MDLGFGKLGRQYPQNIHNIQNMYYSVLVFLLMILCNFDLIEIENVLLDIAPKTAHNQHN